MVEGLNGSIVTLELVIVLVITVEDSRVKLDDVALLEASAWIRNNSIKQMNKRVN